MSNYEYNKGRGALGALGWSKNWEVPMSTDVARDVPCAGGGTLTCASGDEQAFMANQGCVPSVYGPNGLDACRESSGQAGSLFCCPSGRPGTATTPVTAVAQAPVNRNNISALQNYIVAQGCSVGSSGVDGIFGPQTRAGLQCVIDQTSYVNVAGRFPFISTLIATPTGQPRPANFTFDPGTTAKTPEQVVASGSPGGGGGQVVSPGSTPADIQADQRRQASVFGALPWWGWALIAVGGLGALGVVGYMALGGEEDEYDEFEEEDEHEHAYGGYGY